MNKRKIAVITGSRADYGLLYWIIKEIDKDPKLALQLVVTGTHLSGKFGASVKEIERCGFNISEKIKMRFSSDSSEAISGLIGRGIIAFARAYARLRPDIILVLGDRFEIYAAVSAAVPFRIPVAHMYGGEITKGAFDEQLRHAITKLSHIHFTSTLGHKRRLIQMGESPNRVFCVGASGIDNIKRLKLLSHKELCKRLNIPGHNKIGIVTYHPPTLQEEKGGEITELLGVLKEIKDIYWIFTSTNPDCGSRLIMRKINEFVEKHHKNAKLFLSLGQENYLSLLKNSVLMIGNSSSGLIEAPSFKLPVVNIGDRQSGRLKAENVIDIARCRRDAILQAINKAKSSGFRCLLKGIRNPYGNGGTSQKVVKVLKKIKLGDKLIKKEFYDLKSINY